MISKILVQMHKQDIDIYWGVMLFRSPNALTGRVSVMTANADPIEVF